jgi:exodeoxyribonuclease (lambda-induced)
MKIHEMEQRSDEWFSVRLGKFTGTDFATVANGKKPTKKTLELKKAAEIITKTYAESTFKNFHMERGVELEEEARMAFELEIGVDVREVGFVEMNEFIGISPDGLIGDYAGLELKCKDAHTHLKCLLEGDKAYKWQIQGALFVTGRNVWYFASYNPSYALKDRLYVKVHKPDKECFEMLEKGLSESVANVQGLIEKYKGR